jgi:hypothetical protein
MSEVTRPSADKQTTTTVYGAVESLPSATLHIVDGKNERLREKRKRKLEVCASSQLVGQSTAARGQYPAVLVTGGAAWGVRMVARTLHEG